MYIGITLKSLPPPSALTDCLTRDKSNLHVVIKVYIQNEYEIRIERLAVELLLTNSSRPSALDT